MIVAALYYARRHGGWGDGGPCGPPPMGLGNCTFGMSMEKVPLMDGDVRQNNFGCEIVPDGSHEDGDEGFELFQEWLSVCEDVKTIWDAGWALGQDGPHVATPNQRSEALRADSLSRRMVPLDLGAPELDVAVARPRKLAFEFCKRQTGGEGAAATPGATSCAA